MTRFAVVILNWNGAPDTIACLRSIRETDREAVPIVVDNGSADDSVPRILGALASPGMRVVSGHVDEVMASMIDAECADAVVVRAGENLGFAAGCNLGLRIADRAGFAATVFLNNDTEVAAGALARVVDRLAQSPAWYAVLPLIMIHGTGRIWNAGGTISRLGFRRYHFAGAVRAETLLPRELVCSFFTGCCFAVRTAEFLSRGGFTERFFFGEEDFELALWMKDHGQSALCLTDAVIQHKVGASISRAAGSAQARKVFVHYLNRFIHMRLRFGGVRWTLWLAAYVPYVALLLARSRIVPVRELRRFFTSCIARAGSAEGVTRADFVAIMTSRPW